MDDNNSYSSNQTKRLASAWNKSFTATLTGIEKLTMYNDII